MTVYRNGLTIGSERFGSDRTGASGWRGGVAKGSHPTAASRALGRWSLL